MKIYLLIAYSKIDLSNFVLKHNDKELPMDVVLMNIEETMEIKISKQEVTLFKKEFENYFLVPL